jgi:hypothetical protein
MIPPSLIFFKAWLYSKLMVKDLLVWESFSRPTKRYSGPALGAIGLMVLAISIVLVFFEEWLAVLVSWSAYFLFYVLAKVSPEKVAHKITTQGIVSMGHSYLWEGLGPFWFASRGGETVLHIASRSLFGHLALLIDPADQEKFRETLVRYLPYVELPEKSAFEKLVDWFDKKFPPDK